jgi:Coenzyme PQQ synthesis protein D (PqqD)
MTKKAWQQVPRARKEGLVVEELPDEVLIYDEDRNKAHCLNQTAALIWKHCDGQTSVEGVASLLERELKTPVKEEVIWFALDQLGKYHLLQEPIVRPSEMPKFSRRELVKKLGLAASIPMVLSILAPEASAALSCVNNACPQGTCKGSCVCVGGRCQ